ncbi:MAG: hypothetical protein ABR592_00770 [Nitriliruptorales bacterium]
MSRARQPFQAVERLAVESYEPGAYASGLRAGDFILTHGRAWTSRLIRFGQRLRIHGDDRKYTRWNHVALIVHESGDLVEALGAGVTRRKIAAYDATEYQLVRITASDEDREQVVAFAEWSVGQPYAWLTIVSIALSLLTGAKFTFAYEGQHICSGLVARALERTGTIFNRTPSHIMPADLAKYFSVEPPPPSTPSGTPPP